MDVDISLAAPRHGRTDALAGGQSLGDLRDGTVIGLISRSLLLAASATKLRIRAYDFRR